jgi:hypothetical protein
MSITSNLEQIKDVIPSGVTLVAVSKTKPNEAIEEAYNAGQRIFGENKVQELVGKQEKLPKDIEWHMIGHLQSNKVKYIAPFVSLIHAVDSLKLLKEINKQGKKNDRIIPVLLQMHIAEEETKFGLDKSELMEVLLAAKELTNVEIKGLMGMATFTDNQDKITKEFDSLKLIFDEVNSMNQIELNTLSMGMSGDFQLAISCGSTMVRVGSSIFGERHKF